MVVQPGALLKISVFNLSFLEVRHSAVRIHQSKLQSTVYSPWRATTMEVEPSMVVPWLLQYRGCQ